ncbi:MAG: hypothetical protein NVS9B11_17560 [Candidatus Dormibacteraceae bacterium]
MTEKLKVRKPGLLTTMQDLGRPNAVMAGVPPGGAMDRFAHRAANLLVANDDGAATLECTLNGPELVALESCLIAISGADFDPRVNGRPIEMWAGIFLHEGDELTFAGRRSGAPRVHRSGRRDFRRSVAWLDCDLHARRARRNARPPAHGR